jgi:AraC-like DNA-binding protein
VNRTVLFLSSIRSCKSAGSLPIANRRIPVHMLAVLVKGGGRLVVDDQACEIQALQARLFAPGMRVSFFPGEEETEYVLLLLDVVTLGKQDGQWREAGKPELPIAWLKAGAKLHQEMLVMERLERLRQEATGEADDALVQFAFQELLALIVRDGQRVHSNPEESFEYSIRYIEEHLQRHISIAELADIAGLTLTSYSRKFKKLIGMSPVDYMNGLRIEAAKKRLSEQGSTVKAVAAQVGFNSEFYFSRMFKEATGLAPNLYIRRRKLAIATVACNHYDESLRSLGVEPVMSMNGYRYPGMDARKHLKRLEQQLLALTAAKPDLIIMDRYHVELYDRLKQIASVMMLSYDEDWKVTYRRIAEVSGQERRAGEVLSGLEAAAHQARKRLSRSFGSGSLALLRITPDLVRIQPALTHPLNDLLYTELGLSTGELQPASAGKLEFAPEQLSAFSLQSDFLFIQEHFWGAGSGDMLDRVHNSTFWTENEAVQQDRIRYIPNWFAMSWTPPGRSKIMNSLLSGQWG